jgi:hypothetical protein
MMINSLACLTEMMLKGIHFRKETSVIWQTRQCQSLEKFLPEAYFAVLKHLCWLMQASTVALISVPSD